MTEAARLHGETDSPNHAQTGTTHTHPPPPLTHTHVNMHKLLGLGHAEAVVKMLTAHAAGLVARALYNPSPPPLV